MKPNPPVLAFVVPGIVGCFMVLGAAASVIFSDAFPRAIIAATLLLGAVPFVPR